MTPPSEHVHWMFATGFLFLGLCLLAEAVVGQEVWARRPWRPYLWPGLAFVMGIFMFPVMVFYTTSTIHMLAHGLWAQVMMVAGAAELGLVRGKLKSPYWKLAAAAAFFVSGFAFLLHEQNDWLFQRSSFLHHAEGWIVIGGSAFALARALRPRWIVANAGFALLFVAVAFCLYCDRDLAPIFGHLSPLAGNPHR